MNKLTLSNYNLEKTLLGGQAFNWDYINGSFYGFTLDKIIKITPVEAGILWQTYPEPNQAEYVITMLNNRTDYDTILKSINKDDQINKAINSIKNVHILKQDFDQSLLSFILTAHKNIKAVRKVVRELSKAYGNKIVVDGIDFYTFPSAQKLSTLTELDIKAVGAGFRSRYVLEAAKQLAVGVLSESVLVRLPEDQARKELVKLNGVGDKVADCVLTFGLGFYSVTPIDIWAFRALEHLYGLNIKTKYSNLRTWYSTYFGEYTAWAGQFLFEYLRDNYKDIKNISTK